MTDEIKDGEPTPDPQAVNNIRVDYTWYNTLVDDNGTGNGTVWNKAAVLGSLNSVDAGFVKLDPWGQWIAVPFVPGNFIGDTNLGFQVTAANVTRNRYMRIGNTIWWQLNIAGAPLFGAPGYLFLRLPGGCTPASDAALNCVVYGQATVARGSVALLGLGSGNPMGQLVALPQYTFQPNALELWMDATIEVT